MIHLLEHALRAIHLLSAAAWFGSLVYRVFVVDRKMASFFGGGSEYERFALHLAHGMRYVVLAALVTCGLSGFALAGIHWNASVEWQSLMAMKMALWVLAFALFGYISWVYWPRRVFTDASEWNAIRRRGLVLSLAMIGIAGLAMVLGQLGQSVVLATAEQASASHM